MVFLYGCAAMLITSSAAVTWLGHSREGTMVLRTRAAS
jgi:hypothetical protein